MPRDPILKDEPSHAGSDDAIRPEEGRHAYLNAIGIKSSDPCVFASTDKSDDRQPRFAEERAIHSFDSRETWSLDYTLATWLYEHLCTYKEYAGQIVDLSYHKVKVRRLRITKKGNVKTESAVMSEEEAVDLACDYLRRSLTEAWDDVLRLEYEAAALRIVEKLLPVLWW